MVWREQKQPSGRQSSPFDLLTMLAWLPSLPFSGEATQLCGEIRADLARKGTPIGPYDLQIAAIALSHNCTLVSNNTDEFSRVAGLKLEDWQAA